MGKGTEVGWRDSRGSGGEWLESHVGGRTLKGLECHANKFGFIWSEMENCWKVKGMQTVLQMRK